MTNKRKGIGWFVLGLIIKLFILVFLVCAAIFGGDDNPESKAVLIVLGFLFLVGSIEHVANPRDELTGEYRFF